MKVVPVQIGVQGLLLDGGFQAGGKAGLKTVQLTAQEIMDPGQHLGDVAGVELDDLLAMVRDRSQAFLVFCQVGDYGPGIHTAVPFYTCGNVFQVTSFSFGEFCDEEVSQGSFVGKILVFHRMAVVVQLVGHIVIFGDDLPLVADEFHSVVG